MMRDKPILTPSYKSAFVMAAILITTIYSVLWFFELVVHGRPEPFAPTLELAGPICGALMFVTLVLTLPTAIAIHGLDASHFGLQGVIRWLAMGLLLGLALSVLLVLFPRRQPGDSAWLATVRWLARAALGLGSIYWSYWLTLKAPPWRARCGDRREDPTALPPKSETEVER